MSSEAERLERAGRYVLGLMDDAERDRAERDLEFDAKFRAAVVGVAERMHLFDRGKGQPEPNWQAIASKIAALPHMHAIPPPAIGDATPTVIGRPRDVKRIGAHSVPNRMAVLLAVVIAVAFAAGYVAGIWSATP